jgi:hypothetical protein
MIFKRPWLVLLILLFVIGFAVINLLRALNGVRLWGFLSELPLAVSPLYLVLTGGLWSVLLLRLAWWVWQGDPRTPAMVKTVSVVYVLYYWAERIFLMTSPLRFTSWPFLVVVSAGLAFSFFEIFRYDSVKSFFGGEHGQKDSQ